MKKIKLTYRQASGIKNIFGARGKTNYFIQKVDILDRNPMDVFRRD